MMNMGKYLKVTPELKVARELRSLLSEGWIYVGKVDQKYFLRHPNGNRATIYQWSTYSELYINGHFVKDL